MRQCVKDIARQAKERLLSNNNEDFREQIVETALGYGCLSTWVDIFSDDTDMCQRLNKAFNVEGV